MNLYNRRKRGHDYRDPFIYHLILKKRQGAPDFGRIVGDASICPGQPGCAKTDYSKLGYALSNALRIFENKYPEFKKIQYAIMPDHIHLIIRKLRRTEIHLEIYIEIYKDLVVNYYREDGGLPLNKEDIFEPRFTDKLLYRGVNLDDWVKYVSDNPHRRAMIIQKPEFFSRVRGLKIGNESFDAYGNLFLFRNPDKFPVRIRRHFSPEERKNHEIKALEAIETGTVLVSPFISQYEKEIRDKAIAKGGKLIIIQHEEFGEKFKPPKTEFKLCENGCLLLISLGLPKGTSLTYEIATRMNELGAKISRLCR